MPNSLQLHGLQHIRLPCPSLPPSLHTYTIQQCWWCHPTISSSVTLFLPSLFPSIRVFSNESALPIRWPENWSFSLSPSNEYSGWFLLGLTGLISLLSKGLSKVLHSTTIWRYQFFSAQPSLWSNSHICIWLLEKNLALTMETFVSKVKSLPYSNTV